MQKISKEVFDKLYPDLWRIFNHSGRKHKYWATTSHGRSFYVVENIQKHIKDYWRYNK